MGNSENEDGLHLSTRNPATQARKQTYRTHIEPQQYDLRTGLPARLNGLKRAKNEAKLLVLVGSENVSIGRLDCYHARSGATRGRSH